MSKQLTLWDTGNATFSRESVVGLTPCSSQAGQSIAKSGPAVAPASRSQRQGFEEEKTTSGTSGQSSENSSDSESLQLSLGNRLRQKLGETGSLEYDLTWKQWDMNSGGGDLCASCVGSPHIRQRLFWVVDANDGRSSAWRTATEIDGHGHTSHAASGDDRRLGNSYQPGPQRFSGHDTDGSEEQGWHSEKPARPCTTTGIQYGGPWSEYELVSFADGKVRRVQPGSFPLAHGLPQKLVRSFAKLHGLDYRASPANRRGRIEGYGNAIVPQLAAVFIQAFMEATEVTQ